MTDTIKRGRFVFVTETWINTRYIVSLGERPSREIFEDTAHKWSLDMVNGQTFYLTKDEYRLIRGEMK